MPSGNNKRPVQHSTLKSVREAGDERYVPV
jgi:hypothetical protein